MSDFGKKLARILGRRHRATFVLLLAAMLVEAILAIAGVGSILPFMALVMDPGLIESNPWVARAYRVLGFETHAALVTFAGFLSLSFIMLANVSLAVTTWLQNRFSWTVAHDLASRLVGDYARRPYAFFLNHNTSSLAKQVLVEVYTFTTGLLFPTTVLCARTLSSFCVFLLLVVVNPWVACVATVVLGAVYAAIYLSVRRQLARMGEIRNRSVEQRFMRASELFSGIKSIKTLDCDRYFTERFDESSLQYSRAQIWASTLAGVPRYVLETLAFGGIVVAVLLMYRAEDDISSYIPLLSLYALAGYRLLPSLQRIYQAASQIRFNFGVIDTIYTDLFEPEQKPVQPSNMEERPLTFARRICLKNIVFRYPDAHEHVLKGISLDIPRGARVAITGQTGSGKTTLADLILGLLQPEHGTLWIDDEQITGENVAQWRQMVGYVPQEVFFTDDTIARNIAFGVDDACIDMERVRWAASVAQMADLIEQDLPRGYDTIIGERGVRLSGGQRQRLGLARALYRLPQVLVLDEATSALDGITEEAVMDAINRLDYPVTIIIIAHRLATVRNCDFVYLLAEGRVAEQGTYTDLIAGNPMFHAMACLAT